MVAFAGVGPVRKLKREGVEFKDYYKILGLEPEATDAEIKSAYRNLARSYHPDLNQEDARAEARFKEVNEANEVLGDPEKRAKYDELRRYRDTYGEMPGMGQGDFGGFEGFQGFRGGPGAQGATYRFYTGDGFAEGAGGNFGDFSDFFETLFGGGAGGFSGGSGPFRGGSRVFRGGDLRSELTVTLEDLYHGAERQFELNGERVKVRIPAGFPEGGTLKLTGQGRPGQGGGPRGDLLLKVRAREHERFTRRGDDLHCEVEVDLYTMLLGGSVTLATPDGALKLNVPTATQNGTVLRLKERGMPVFATGAKSDDPARRGTLYAKLIVRLPETLSDDERAAFTRLAGRDPVQTD